jgi:hypothetical protein
MAKDSARSIVKCLNTSLKASSNIVARTIVEMIGSEQLHRIDSAVDTWIDRFCHERNYSVRMKINKTFAEDSFSPFSVVARRQSS